MRDQLPPRLHPLFDWLGWRGFALLAVALLWIAIGANVLLDPNRNPHLFHTHLPVWLRLCFWWGAAAGAIIFAWWPCKQSYGFGCLLVPLLQRFLSYLWALVTAPQPAFLVQAAIWGFCIIVVLLFAFGLKPTKRAVELWMLRQEKRT